MSSVQMVPGSSPLREAGNTLDSLKMSPWADDIQKSNLSPNSTQKGQIAPDELSKGTVQQVNVRVLIAELAEVGKQDTKPQPEPGGGQLLKEK